MANSPVKTARIQPGSALERMLQGHSFTAVIHALAERVEQMQREPHFSSQPAPIDVPWTDTERYRK